MLTKRASSRTMQRSLSLGSTYIDSPQGKLSSRGNDNMKSTLSQGEGNQTAPADVAGMDIGVHNSISRSPGRRGMSQLRLLTRYPSETGK